MRTRLVVATLIGSVYLGAIFGKEWMFDKSVHAVRDLVLISQGKTTRAENEEQAERISKKVLGAVVTKKLIISEDKAISTTDPGLRVSTDNIPVENPYSYAIELRRIVPSSELGATTEYSGTIRWAKDPMLVDARSIDTFAEGLETVSWSERQCRGTEELNKECVDIASIHLNKYQHGWERDLENLQKYPKRMVDGPVVETLWEELLPR